MKILRVTGFQSHIYIEIDLKPFNTLTRWAIAALAEFINNFGVIQKNFCITSLIKMK
jgi:hypothetical protein